MLRCRGNEQLHVCLAPYVCGDKQRAIRCTRYGRNKRSIFDIILDAARTVNDRGSLFQEAQHDALTDALRAAGYDRNAALEPLCVDHGKPLHVVSLSNYCFASLTMKGYQIANAAGKNDDTFVVAVISRSIPALQAPRVFANYLT
jgi:hypothetical protein